MKSSFYLRTIPKITLALVALTVGVFLSRGDPASAVLGSPSFAATTVTTLSDLRAGAPANTNLVFDIVLNDYNFSAVINGTPSTAFIAPGPGNPGFAPNNHPALGDVMGTLTSTSSLGTFGSVCDQGVIPAFTFLNATVDNSLANTIDAVPQASVNPGGSGGTLDNMWSDDGSSTTGLDALSPWNEPWDGVNHGAGKALTVAERTNGLPAQVDNYPSYLNIVFDPDFPVTPGTNAVQPLARYAGAVNVVGTSVVLDQVVFAPGALSVFPAGHPLNIAAGSMGYTTIAVLNDTTTPAAVSSITDFCSPLNTITNIYGRGKINNCSPLVVAPALCDQQAEISAPPAGADQIRQRYRNPALGAYTWNALHQSLRDADLDGIENSLDACPLNADTYNPRTGLPLPADADGDRLPATCDPNDSVTNLNQDGDLFLNSGDNCPLIANDTQADAEVTTGSYATVAPSGGPRGDGMGDICDADDAVSNGAFLSSTTPNSLTIVAAPNSDSDGYTDVDEFEIGTSSIDQCGFGDVTGGPPSNAWPSNLSTAAIPNSVNRVNVLDLTSFLAPVTPVNLRRLGTWPGSPVADGQFSSRWDLQPRAGVFGQWINATDITTMTGANPAVPQNFPPMLGVRAWNGPDCAD